MYYLRKYLNIMNLHVQFILTQSLKLNIFSIIKCNVLIKFNINEVLKYGNHFGMERKSMNLVFS